MSTVLESAQGLRAMLPEGALAAGAVLALAWDLAAKGAARARGAATIALVASIAAGVLAARALRAASVATASTALFDGQLAADRYATTFRLFFAIVTAVVVVAAAGSREARTDAKVESAGGELMALLLVIALGMNLMAMATNLLMIYLSIEIVSVLSFVLAGFKLDDRKSSEAALKYVVFGGVSSGVMLYGMSWLYGLTGSLDLRQIAEQVTTLTRGQPHLPGAIVVGAACVMAGFAYKISAVPFHMWAPDVYEGSPTLVAALFSVGPKAAGFAVLVRFFFDALHAPAASAATPGTPWPIVAGVVAVATMTVGNLSALAQTNLKRLLAFSSIAHAGNMLLAFSAFTDDGVAAILFYIAAYCAMNLGAFVVVQAIADRNGGDETIAAVRGLGTRAPMMAAAMAIFLFSLVGLPPFAGFVAKVYVFAALLRAGGAYQGWYWLLAVLGVINTVISLFYYARVLRAMYLEPAATPEREASPVRVRALYGAVTAALIVPTIGLGVYWGPLYDFVAKAATGR